MFDATVRKHLAHIESHDPSGFWRYLKVGMGESLLRLLSPYMTIDSSRMGGMDSHDEINAKQGLILEVAILKRNLAETLASLGECGLTADIRVLIAQKEALLAD